MNRKPSGRAEGALALAFVLTLAALGSARADRGDAGVSARDVRGEHHGEGETVRLDDAQSAHLITTINTGEIGLARLALARSQNERVRRFADEMIRAHGDAQDRIDGWARESHATPMANAVSEQVARDAGTVHRMLETADHFDRAYTASQVAMHADALRLIDERILPGSRDSRFRALVGAIRDDVVHHLEMARPLEQVVR